MIQWLSGLDWQAVRCGPVAWAFLAILVSGFVLAGFAVVYAGVATLAERKIAGHMQARMGPMRVGPHGTLQWIADSIKLLVKEDLVPRNADAPLFRLAPYVVFAASLCCWVALPYAPSWSPASFNIGILYIMAVSSVVVIGILMAGWSSGSKWALLGAMRSAAQIVSYEVPMGLTLLGMLLIYGTLDMQEIVRGQEAGFAFGLWEVRGGLWSWGIVRHPPFTIAAFLVYYTAALAETNRTPFDIPEADSELVAGYHTEYSGMRFAFFFLSEYANMFVVSAIAATVFLGGWLPPFTAGEAAYGVAGGLAGASAGYLARRRLTDSLAAAAAGLAVGVLVGAAVTGGDPSAQHVFFGARLGEPVVRFVEGVFWFTSKCFILIFVMMWLRWTLPRYRVDQLMDLGWKKLTPLAFINLLAVGLLETRGEWWRALGSIPWAR